MVWARSPCGPKRLRISTGLPSALPSQCGTWVWNSAISPYGRGIEEFLNGYQYLDLTALGRQEAWEEPKGRAAPLGLRVGGPAMRLPDQYDT